MCLLWEADQAATCLAGVSHPGSQEDVVSNREPAHWWNMPSLGLRVQQLLAFWLGLSHACLSASGGEGSVCSQLALLMYWFKPLYCEQHARLFISAFSWKSFFFSFLVSLAISRFGLLSHISSLRLSSGYSGSATTLRTDDAAYASLPSPTHWWQMRMSVLLLLRQLGAYTVFLFFFFPSWLSCPLRFQTPHKPTCERVSFCAKLLLLHDSLPRMGLCP